MKKLTRQEIYELIRKFSNNPLGVLDACGGLYICPKDESGKRLGPLVGYAGTYTEGKQYVGDIYANFAKAEEYVDIINYWALAMSSDEEKDLLLSSASVFIGLPEGGKSFAMALSSQPGHSGRYIYLEKVVTAVKTETEREKSKLVFNRHDIIPGDKIVLVEDLQNNFSTTGKAIDQVISVGGEVIALASIMNRSPFVDTVFTWNNKEYPVLTLLRRPYPEYEQTDSYVAEDVQKGNVIWKPKNDWVVVEKIIENYPNKID
ncbi:phosphoribosyltransferase [Patescibacteria group bacterium]|nr:phosphoribosyltransferase [Patescibacteria group bacterium]